MRRFLLYSILLPLACSNVEEVPQLPSSSCVSTDPCIEQHFVGGGACVASWTGASCEQGQCVFGECLCVSQCGQGDLQAIQMIRQRQGGVSGLRGARAVAASPDGAYIYVAASLDGQVRILNASLAPVGAVSLPEVSGLAVLPGGTQLVAGTLEGGELIIYDRDVASGALSERQRVNGPFLGVRHLAIRTDPPQIIVAASQHESVAVLDRASDGRWALSDQLTAPGGGLNGLSRVRLDASQQNLWAVAHGGEIVTRFEATGAEWNAVGTWRASDGHTGFDGVRDVAVSPDGGWLYIAGSRGIATFEVGSNSLTLTDLLGAPFPDGLSHGWDDASEVGLEAMRLTPAGDRVVATAFFGAYVMVCDRDSATGKLSNPQWNTYRPAYTDDHFDVDTGGRTMGYDPLEDLHVVALESVGTSMYMASRQWDTVLRLEGTAPLSVAAQTQEGQGGVINLGGAYSVTLSPDEKHLYVAAWNAPEIAGFARNAETGTLVPLPAVAGAPQRPVDYGLSDVAVAPDGRQVFGVDDEKNALHVYDREVTTGALSWRATVGEEAQQEVQVAVAVSGDGTSVYTGAFESDTLVRFSRSVETGEVAMIEVLHDDTNGVDGLDGLEDILVSPDSSQVYVASFEDGSVSCFDRSPSDGALTLRQVLREESSSNRLYAVEAIAFTPGATQLIATSPVTDTLIVLDRGEDGTLSIAHSTRWPKEDWGPAGPGPDPSPGRIVVSPDGTQVFVSYRLWDRLAVFDRAADSGALSWSETLAGSPEMGDGLQWPNGVTASTDGRFVYVVNMLGDSVTVWQRKASASGEPDGCGGLCL